MYLRTTERLEGKNLLALEGLSPFTVHPKGSYAYLVSNGHSVKGLNEISEKPSTPCSSRTNKN